MNFLKPRQLTKAKSVLLLDPEFCNGDASEGDNVIIQYPNNLTIRDLYYFMAVPSLCYELNFPRTSRIRKRFLIKRVFEVILGMQVVFGLFQQWIIPSVKNSLNTFSVRRKSVFIALPD